jgi:dolichol-phosphate mannosyltransferase
MAPSADAAAPPRTAVVVPTYNEAKNIAALIDAVRGVLPGVSVYIVDDSSPDGTADAVRSRVGPEVHLVVREKKDGRGGAVLEGLRRALASDPPFERFVEMDADFSHEPKELPRLIALVEEPGVLGVGSRYMEGSRIEGWPLKRRLFSGFVNALLRIVVDRRYSDLSNGFRCYRRDAVERLLAHEFRTRGYIVLSEQALVLRRAGLRPSSMPTVFVNRVRGVSNVTVRELANAAKGLLRLVWMRLITRD